MSFHSQGAFFVLIPLLLLVAYVFWRRSQRTPSLQYSQIQVFKKMALGTRAKLWWLPEALKVLGLIYVVVALARPQTSDTQTKRNV